MKVVHAELIIEKTAAVFGSGLFYGLQKMGIPLFSEKLCVNY